LSQTTRSLLPRAAIAQVEPQIGAFVETWSDEQTENAAAPFAGVPFAIKDLALAMRGRKSELGSRLAEGMVADQDSTLMRKFRSAGFVTVGRTTTPEMAISTTTEPVVPGATRNPWNPEFSAGGSSGGSGAAVGSGIVPIAHATDGGGSIRVPASCNGVFGLKPTRGRISNGPVVDEVWSGLAVQFALTRSVRDSAALMDAVHGGSEGEPYYIPDPERSYLAELEREPGKLRIGLMQDAPSGKLCDPAVKKAVHETASLCESLGHIVEPVPADLGVSWEAFVTANTCFWAANTAAWLEVVARLTGRQIGPELLEPVTLAVYDHGKHLSALDLLHALDVRNGVTRHFGGFFTRYDMLLTPSVPGLPPRLGEYNVGNEKMSGPDWVAHVFERAAFSAGANVAGLPAMSIPLGYDQDTYLPIGSQFVAGFGEEAALYRLAGQLERSRPWKDRRPAVWPRAGV
jgi:amidase